MTTFIAVQSWNGVGNVRVSFVTMAPLKRERTARAHVIVWDVTCR